jgi:hypothetical protein
MVVHDVEQRFVDLADVVEECNALDGVTAALVETSGFGDNESVGRNAAHVLTRVSVVGFNGIEKRLHARGGEPLYGLTGAALSNYEERTGGD